jgi:hypothetical protein
VGSCNVGDPCQVGQVQYADKCIDLQCEAPKIAFSWFITPISLWFIGDISIVDISIVKGGYKPTYNWGAQPCGDQTLNSSALCLHFSALYLEL